MTAIFKPSQLETILRAAKRPIYDDENYEAWNAGAANERERIVGLIRAMADRYDVGSVHYGHFAEILKAIEDHGYYL